MAWCLLLLSLLVLAACARGLVRGDEAADHAPTPPAAGALRIATYNASLNSDEAGGLLRRLEGDDDDVRKVAAVLQVVRPDIVLINEFDYVADGSAADMFQTRWLERPQPGGGAALHYPYRYLAPVNTGVPSGLDLDNSGSVGGQARDRGNDAWGYGLHPGQYGMLLLSRYPIDAAAARTFQMLRWSAMPDAMRPRDPATGGFFHPDAVWSQLRLSSKSHWDVPVRTPQGRLHILASHPTPPAFDGPERRNVARNHDEIRFWTAYLSDADTRDWQCDDAGTCGGLERDARFVILGDLNADPVDGSGEHGAIVDLLEHPRVLRMATPRSEGAVEAAARDGGANAVHRGAAAHDTGQFGPRVGNLRIDYVLPSVGQRPVASGVFWPPSSSPHATIVDGTDHRLVWVDVIRD
ncbi:endonuclease/exonuclease/phosphatase family protein [Luteimonas deserti]|uniref:Endonuclease/exonuclease/phosphatase family protein n=1 Tax=Luteimonas deserti TaxID=2752306 RepID=A0A7Z0U142_9GAMM|nr:endonuclease/exonuclease/phosphatase family protein [Luteimonas deserti]NYZ63953.1 endonuclease/exonuclease/phosphatase family protein [Luteimonas deserti]